MTKQQLEAWNKAHPIGSECEVQTMRSGPWTPTRIRSEAWFLGHDEPVACVEGKAGGYLLSFIRFPKPNEPNQAQGA